MRKSMLVWVFVTITVMLACGSKKSQVPIKSDFVGTWEEHVPGVDIQVTFVVSMDQKGIYSIRGEAPIKGGYTMKLNINNVRIEGGTLKFSIGSESPIAYELNVVNKDALSAKIEYPDAPGTNRADVIWKRLNPEFPYKLQAGSPQIIFNQFERIAGSPEMVFSKGKPEKFTLNKDESVRAGKLIFLGPCEIEIMEDGTLATTREGTTVKDNLDNTWESRATKIGGKIVYAFFLRN